MGGCVCMQVWVRVPVCVHMVEDLSRYSVLKYVCISDLSNNTNYMHVHTPTPTHTLETRLSVHKVIGSNQSIVFLLCMLSTRNMH